MHLVGVAQDGVGRKTRFEGAQHNEVTFVNDLGAINICVNAGIGSHFDLRLGGKCGPASGDPVDMPVTVQPYHQNTAATPQAPQAVQTSGRDDAFVF